MSGKHLKLLAGVVAALFALWGITALLPSRTDRASADFRIPRVAVDSVTTITITTPVDTIALARAANRGAWTVNGLAASRAKVEDLIGTFGEPVRPELVAHSRTSFARLGVDSTASRRLRVFDRQRVLVDLIVSAKGVGFEGTFVRLPGDSAVYSWSGRLGELVRRTFDDWRDNVIAQVTTDSVRRIDVTRGARRYSLTRNGGRWFLAGTPADSGATARLVDAFKTVTASGFPTRAQLDSAFRPKDRIERHVALYGNAGAPLLALDLARHSSPWTSTRRAARFGCGGRATRRSTVWARGRPISSRRPTVRSANVRGAPRPPYRAHSPADSPPQTSSATYTNAAACSRRKSHDSDWDTPSVKTAGSLPRAR